ncbi:MAG: alginate export family protein [Woeseiaceae bacterium]
MHKTKRWLAVSLAALVFGAGNGHTQTDTPDRAQVFGGDLAFDVRLRYESATDEIANDADALTLRSALAWKSDALFGHRSFTGAVEVENTLVIGGANYSDGETNRSTVLIADPAGTEINQGYLAYRSASGWQTTVGRQLLSFGDERFVGTVAFRQNHQSFDALSFGYGGNEDWLLSYAYVANVNRIFGDDADGPNAGLLGDHEQDTHLLNAVFKGWSVGELESYAYLIENKDFQRASTNTIGLKFSGSVRPKKLTYLYTIEAANQQSGSRNPRDYAAMFWRASAGVSYKRFSIQFTQERLGSDNSAGFVTPFATLHRFQGWADKFVAQTPDDGLVNNFVTIAGRWPGFRYRIQFHDFETDVGSRSLGHEIGFHLQHRIRQNLLIGVKFADYRASRSRSETDGFATDTRRLFLTASAKFGDR